MAAVTNLMEIELDSGVADDDFEAFSSVANSVGTVTVRVTVLANSDLPNGVLASENREVRYVFYYLTLFLTISRRPLTFQVTVT